MTVYELIQELALYSADAEVVFVCESDDEVWVEGEIEEVVSRCDMPTFVCKVTF